MTQNVETKVKLMPIMMGSRLPRCPTGNIWNKDPIPAMIMAAWIRAAACSVGIFTAPVTIRMGAMFATNMASTCCKPKGTAFFRLICPSNW